jgi:hypothetical protein
MLIHRSSVIMPRTTVNIDAPILRDLRRLQKREGKSLGRLISDLLAQALRQHEERRPVPPAFGWVSRPMGARVDLADKEAVRAVLEQEENAPAPRPARGR